MSVMSVMSFSIYLFTIIVIKMVFYRKNLKKYPIFQTCLIRRCLKFYTHLFNITFFLVQCLLTVPSENTFCVFCMFCIKILFIFVLNMESTMTSNTTV